MLEFQLQQLRPCLREDTVIIAAGMTRNIHNSTMEAFASIIGPTHSTLAKKKARLILSKLDKDIDVPGCDYPVDYELEIQSAEGGEQQSIILSNHAGVFSAAKLDPGTRLFLQHIAPDPRYRTIIDLGCGNGLLGIMAALKNPYAKLVFADESFMAVDSAAINFQRIFPEVAGETASEAASEAAREATREATFLQTDCLHGVEADSADLILCNPPFHQNNVITDSVAWRMFSESRDVLRPGGELWVIGNRHLAYHAKLKHLFGNCETIASDKRFSLVRAVKKG
jgi:16S rRNA (guanine1207-N2)-methyltransferase